jgi:hypothetical protein
VPTRAAAPSPATQPAVPIRAASTGEPHQLTVGRSTRPQQRLLAAATAGARAGDRGGQQGREDRARQAEEEEQDLGVRHVPPRGVQRRAQVVADDGATGGACLQVMGGGGDGGVRGGGIGGQPVRPRDVELKDHQVRPGPGERVEDLVPGRRRQQQDIVRRGRRLRPGRRADLLEERVGLGQVDDAVDADAYRSKAGPADTHGAAGAGVQVGGRLLGDEHTSRGSGERAQRPGERLGVAVRNAQDDPGPGGLRGRPVVENPRPNVRATRAQRTSTWSSLMTAPPRRSAG